MPPTAGVVAGDWNPTTKVCRLSTVTSLGGTNTEAGVGIEIWEKLETLYQYPPSSSLGGFFYPTSSSDGLQASTYNGCWYKGGSTTDPSDGSCTHTSAYVITSPSDFANA